MNADQVMEQSLILLIKKEGLDGKLGKHEIAALYGICGQEIEKELDLAAEFLQASPSKEALLEFYERERAKEAAQIMAAVDTSSSSIDIGALHGINFTPAMWEVVKGSRLAGHVSTLDVLANYYASRWGNAIDGPFAIDAQANKSPSKQAGSGYSFVLAALLLTSLGLMILLPRL